jgi:unsaturated rhamnogalacturonyl hydrolase
MKNLIKSISVLIVSILLLSCKTNEKKETKTIEKPSKESIIKAMAKSNDYFMDKFPDPSQDLVQPPKGKIWKSNIWTWGTYATGLMAFYDVNKDPRLLNYITDWGEKHDWKMSTAEMWNDHLAGQTYIQLYQMDTLQKVRIADVKTSIDAFIKTGDDQGRGFGSNWNWVDAAYMAMPLFAQLGTLTGDDTYYEEMHKLYSNMKNEVGGGLYNEEDGLWWRDASFKPPYLEPNGQDCYWSRGNGWVIGALVRTLNFMPKDAPNRTEYSTILKQMCQALIKVQREDGLWNVSLHDPNNFGGKELTGSALFVYGMAWGINNNLLNAAIYKPVIYKAWNSMVKECMHNNGFLGYVQGTGEQPSSGQPVTFESLPDFEDYGLGAFLLAGSEVYKLK